MTFGQTLKANNRRTNKNALRRCSCHHGQYFVDLPIKLAKYSWRKGQQHKTLWRFKQKNRLDI